MTSIPKMMKAVMYYNNSDVRLVDVPVTEIGAHGRCWLRWKPVVFTAVS